MRLLTTFSFPVINRDNARQPGVNRRRARLLFLPFLLLSILSAPVTTIQSENTCTPRPLIGLEEVAAHIKKTGMLPPNFIRKKDARKLGWNPSSGNLHAVAPCKSIGGDRFSNREKKLPERPGRIWYEADIDYRGGRRGPRRILFSSDGLIYQTLDHYRTFQRIQVNN